MLYYSRLRAWRPKSNDAAGWDHEFTERKRVVSAMHAGAPVTDADPSPLPTELQVVVASVFSHEEPLAVVAAADLPSLTVSKTVDALRSSRT